MEVAIDQLRQLLPYRTIYEKNGNIKAWDPKEMEGEYIPYLDDIKRILSENNLQLVSTFDIHEPDRGTILTLYINN